MLLGSPPDMVHGLPLRGTVTSNVTAGASGIVLYLPPFRKGYFDFFPREPVRETPVCEARGKVGVRLTGKAETCKIFSKAD